MNKTDINPTVLDPHQDPPRAVIPAAIEVVDVGKRFGTTQALDGLDLCVESGAIFAFLGPNGAGKTTTLRCLLGLVAPDTGRLRVLGLDPLIQGREIRRRVGVLLEHDGLYDRLSAWQNLEFHARIHRLSRAHREQRIEELLRSFGLWQRRDDHTVTFSKGMRQKLAVARSLIHNPELLLLDEPFSGLDPVAAVDLRSRIATLANEQQTTVLLTTHDLAHVEKACSRVAVVRDGRVIAEGEPDRLRAQDGEAPVDVEVAGQGLNEAVLAAMTESGHLLGYTMNGGSARVQCSREARAGLGSELATRGVALEKLHDLDNSLEDAFLALFNESQVSVADSVAANGVATDSVATDSVAIDAVTSLSMEGTAHD